MQIREFCAGIGLELPAVEAALLLEPALGPGFSQALERFERDRAGFYSAALAQKDSAAAFLYYYVRFAIERYATYRARGIEDTVFWDTFRDLAIWEDECMRTTGRHGLLEYRWIAQLLDLAVFRLGRLEFEPAPYPEKIVGVPAPAGGETVLMVHIPKDGPLLPEQTAESYARAQRFFALPRTQFFCCSWLLSPALAEILPDGSNILHFQNEYERICPEEGDHQAEERIFGRADGDFAAYPEDSSLQRKAKAYLLAGHSIPVYWGRRIGAQE